MQPLNLELKRRLLAQHSPLGEAFPHRRLTAEVLNRYDGLVQMHCDLCRIAQTDKDSFHWPYENKTSQAENATRAANNEAGAEQDPVDRLKQYAPANAKEAMHAVEDVMSAVLEHYMPYFHSVHDQWAREQQRSAMRVAKRAYKRGLF